MSPQLQTWKDSVSLFPGIQAAYEAWLFVDIAGVLFAEKAGELLTLCPEYFQLSIDEQIGHIRSVSPVWGFSYVVLQNDGVCSRVVIYNRARVKETLAETPAWFFEKLGYPRDVEPESFLETTGRRWRENGRIPDEIGLALGYPVKDVLGYMGLVSLPCTGACGWRIYGNPEPSVSRSREYTKARDRALSFLSFPSVQDPPGGIPCPVPAGCMHALCELNG